MKPRPTDPQSSALGISRRAFLQLSAALGAALLQQTARPSTAPRRGFAHAQCAPTAGSLSIASTFPLPFSHRYFPDAERLLDHSLDAFDLLLVPAYAAVYFIRRGALQILPGVPVWRTGAESRHPGLAYVVFPGNVGGDDALVEVARRLG